MVARGLVEALESWVQKDLYKPDLTLLVWLAGGISKKRLEGTGKIPW